MPGPCRGRAALGGWQALLGFTSQGCCSFSASSEIGFPNSWHCSSPLAFGADPSSLSARGTCEPAVLGELPQRRNFTLVLCVHFISHRQAPLTKEGASETRVKGKTSAPPCAGGGWARGEAPWAPCRLCTAPALCAGGVALPQQMRLCFLLGWWGRSGAWCQQLGFSDPGAAEPCVRV